MKTYLMVALFVLVSLSACTASSQQARQKREGEEANANPTQAPNTQDGGAQPPTPNGGAPQDGGQQQTPAPNGGNNPNPNGGGTPNPNPNGPTPTPNGQGQNQSGNGTTEPERPTIQCKDAVRSLCQRTIEVRGGRYCLKNAFFGRFQCCESCSNNTEVQTELKKQGAAAHPKACDDKKASDGTSYTEWCRRNILNAPKDAPLSCNGPSLVQQRCMRSCGLCDQQSIPIKA